MEKARGVGQISVFDMEVGNGARWKDAARVLKVAQIFVRLTEVENGANGEQRVSTLVNS